MNPETGKWTRIGKSFKPEFEVTNLLPNSENEFRVCAVNAQGESDYLQTDHKICTERAPGPPGKPDITDVDKHSVELSWTPPTMKTGSSPITGILFEKDQSFKLNEIFFN